MTQLLLQYIHRDHTIIVLPTITHCLMSYMHVMQIFLPNPIPFNKFWNTNSSC